MKLLQDLKEYEKIHPEIAQAALKKLCGHLWYLHEQLAVLALFDSEVPNEEKLKIVNNINDKTSTINNNIKRLDVKS